MAIPTPPDIPAPRPSDRGYMELWRKYMEKDLRANALKREKEAWQRAFATTSAILAAVTLLLAVYFVVTAMGINNY